MNSHLHTTNEGRVTIKTDQKTIVGNVYMDNHGHLWMAADEGELDSPKPLPLNFRIPESLIDISKSYFKNK